MTHICVIKVANIGSVNDLPPGRRQAIIWTNVVILLSGPMVTNFSGILIEMYIFSLKKMYMEMSSGNRRPFCLALNVLMMQSRWSRQLWPCNQANGSILVVNTYPKQQNCCTPLLETRHVIFKSWISMRVHSACFNADLPPGSQGIYSLVLTTTHTLCYIMMDIDYLTRQGALSCAGMLSTWCAVKIPCLHRKCLTKLNAYLIKNSRGYNLNYRKMLQNNMWHLKILKAVGVQI